MPRLANDYSNTIVYAIMCNDASVKEFYIGHTASYRKRMSYHKQCCNNPVRAGYHYKVYECIRENGGWSNWSIVVLGNYNCADIKEALQKEREWFDALLPTLNPWRPSISDEESNSKQKENQKRWKEQNPNYFKQYWLNHKKK